LHERAVIVYPDGQPSLSRDVALSLFLLRGLSYSHAVRWTRRAFSAQAQTIVSAPTLSTLETLVEQRSLWLAKIISDCFSMEASETSSKSQSSPIDELSTSSPIDELLQINIGQEKAHISKRWKKLNTTAFCPVEYDNSSVATASRKHDPKTTGSINDVVEVEEEDEEDEVEEEDEEDENSSILSSSLQPIKSSVCDWLTCYACAEPFRSDTNYEGYILHVKRNACGCIESPQEYNDDPLRVHSCNTAHYRYWDQLQ